MERGSICMCNATGAGLQRVEEICCSQLESFLFLGLYGLMFLIPSLFNQCISSAFIEIYYGLLTFSSRLLCCPTVCHSQTLPMGLVPPAVSRQPRAGSGLEKNVLEGCRDCLAAEQNLAKCWPRAEEEVKPCTGFCKGVMPRGRGVFSFWL